MTYLSMKRGDDRTLIVTATSSMESADIVFTARRRPYTDVVITKSTDDGIVIGADPFLTATVALDSEDTETLDPDVLYWDLELVDGAGDTHTIASGRLAIEPDVTYAEP